MSNTATAPQSADVETPAPEAPVEATTPEIAPAPKALDNVPETDAAPKSVAPSTNSNYAPKEVRQALADLLEDLRSKGWTRTAIIAVTGFSDSQVWRGQNLKAHNSEMARWVEFTEGVKAKRHLPPAPKSKKAQAAAEAKALEDAVATMSAKIDAAIARLGDEAKTTAQYKKVVQETLELLSA